MDKTGTMISTKNIPFTLLLAILTFLFFSVGCSSGPYRKVFVYGFGNMLVPKTDTIEDINQKVRERYGSDLFWSPR